MTNLTGIKQLFSLAPKGGKIAEVGVWKGDNAANMLMTVQPSLLLLVDQWQNVGDSTNKRIMGSDPKVAKRFLQNREVVVLRMPSVEAAKLIAPDTLDLVYIDASHQYENVLADLCAWRPKVKSGGLLCGHNWGLFEGVNQAVSDFLKAHFWCAHEYTAKPRGQPASFGLRV